MSVSIPAYNYTNLSANATTQIRTGQGVLHSITINTLGASANVCTVYDETGSGTTATIATINTTSNVETLFYDVTFNTGLKIVIGTGTAANITIAWAPL